MKILAIETSCDDTCAAVLDGLEIQSNIVSSQFDIHKKWGGVVPEAASRAHVEAILPVVMEALESANTTLDSIQGIAVTNRPGLVGSLSIGVAFAKAISVSRGIPWIGIHHLEGHIWSVLASYPNFRGPAISLIVSGGHTELVLVKEFGHYQILGETRDDAAGEAFDKCARALGLGAPGGPKVQASAESWTGSLYPLPIGHVGKYEFSFSGLKTAVSQLIASEGSNLLVPKAAASLQHAITAPLVRKTIEACEAMNVDTACVVGGVSANRILRQRMDDECHRRGIQLLLPPLPVCTDNAAMIGLAGALRFHLGQSSAYDEDVLPSAPLP